MGVTTLDQQVGQLATLGNRRGGNASEPVTQVDGSTGRVVLAPEFFDDFGRVAASRGIRKTTSNDSGPVHKGLRAW